MTPSSTAIHESAHALAVAAAGVRLDYAEIHQDGGGCTRGMTALTSPDVRCKVYLLGACASAMLADHSPESRDHALRVGGSDDFDKALAVARVAGLDVPALVTWASSWVKRNRGAILDLAAVLDSKRRVEGDEVRAVARFYGLLDPPAEPAPAARRGPIVLRRPEVARPPRRAVRSGPYPGGQMCEPRSLGPGMPEFRPIYRLAARVTEPRAAGTGFRGACETVPK